jgi:hypothetical protein
VILKYSGSKNVKNVHFQITRLGRVISDARFERLNYNFNKDLIELKFRFKISKPNKP